MLDDPILHTIGLSDEELTRVANAGWRTRRDVFEKCDTQLMGALGCEAKRVKRLRVAFARQVVRGRTALDLQQDSKKRVVASGFVELDNALDGGARRGTVTELVGPAGSGKTQCCLQLTAACARIGEAVMYLDVENSYRGKRLIQIARLRGWIQDESNAMLDRVLIWRPKTTDELLDSLQVDGAVESGAVASGAGLLVVDSLAALVRTEFSREELRDRQAWLAAAVTALKRVASRANLAVLVTNHVTADLSSTDDGSNLASFSKVTPALGLLWHHFVTTRIVLEPHFYSPPTVTVVEEDAKAAWSWARRPGRITVTKSPSVPETSTPYIIDTCGLSSPQP